MGIHNSETSLFAKLFYAPKIMSFLQGRIPERVLKVIRRYLPLVFMQVAIIDAHGNVLVVLRKRDKGVGFQTIDGQDFDLLLGKHRRAGRWSGQTAKVILRDKLTLDFDPHRFRFLPKPYEIVFYDSEKQEYLHAIIQVAIIQIDEDYGDLLQEYAMEKRLCAEKKLPPPPEPKENDKIQIELKLNELMEKGYYQSYRWMQPGAYANEIKSAVQENERNAVLKNQSIEKFKLIKLAKDPMTQCFAQIMEDIVRIIRFTDLNSETPSKLQKVLQAERKRQEALNAFFKDKEALMSLLKDSESSKDVKKILDRMGESLKIGVETEANALVGHVDEIFQVLKTINDF